MTRFQVDHRTATRFFLRFFLFFSLLSLLYHAAHNEFLSLNRPSFTSTTHPQPIRRTRPSCTSPTDPQPIYQTPPITRFQDDHRTATRVFFVFFCLWSLLYHAGHNEFLLLNRHSCTSTSHL